MARKDEGGEGWQEGPAGRAPRPPWWGGGPAGMEGGGPASACRGAAEALGAPAGMVQEAPAAAMAAGDRPDWLPEG